MKEIKEEFNKWGNILCSQIGRFNIGKVSSSNLIYKFNIILMKTPASYFVGINRLIVKDPE